MTPTPPGPFARLTSFVGSVPNAGLYAGVVLDVLGFGLLVLAWQKVARLSNPGLQLPYLASAGFGGVVLVVVGTALVTAAVRSRDARVRVEQAVEMTLTLREIRRVMETLDVAPTETTALLARLETPLGLETPLALEAPQVRHRPRPVRTPSVLRGAE